MTVRMALRDPEAADRIDSNTPDVWHVARVDGLVLVAACDRHLVLGEDVAVSATSPGMRCQRTACWKRWMQHELSR